MKAEKRRLKRKEEHKLMRILNRKSFEEHKKATIRRVNQVNERRKQKKEA